MIKRTLAALAVVAFLTPAALKAQPLPPTAESAQRVQQELETFVKSYLAGCNRELRPGKLNPSVSQRDGKVVATYIELDPNSAQTELYPSSGQEFAYLAKLTYVEHTYEAVADTGEDAVSGVYRRVKSRRLTELPRYVMGRWVN